MLVAITREVSPAIGDCEVSFQIRQPIDVARAVAQHAAYRTALAESGARLVELPALGGHPDCVFVEDPLLVLDEVAVVTRMGAASRRGESETLAEAAAAYRELVRIEEPGTVEGGDVMRIGKTLYVGLSRRTNVAGIQQLARLLDRFGYWVTPIEVNTGSNGCLHLKSACCFLGESVSGSGATILANRAWIDTDGLCGLDIIDVAPEEPHAANVLRIGDTVMMPSSYPKTRARLEDAGYRVRTVDTSELIKADAGVTCMSLLFEA